VSHLTSDNHENVSTSAPPDSADTRSTAPDPAIPQSAVPDPDAPVSAGPVPAGPVPAGPGPASPRSASPDVEEGDVEEGGDSACWAHLVCPECGAMLDDPTHRKGCPATTT
jgi:hypothetical protein